MIVHPSTADILKEGHTPTPQEVMQQIQLWKQDGDINAVALWGLAACNHWEHWQEQAVLAEFSTGKP